MRYYCIPSSTSEIVTTSPIEAKSLRGLFFVAKKPQALSVRPKLPTMTITVDGRSVMQNVWIFPFMLQNLSNTNIEATAGWGSNYRISDFDPRQVSLTANLNVSQSEIKISGYGDSDNELDIVLMFSDTEVEEESVEYVECVPLYFSDKDGGYDKDINNFFYRLGTKERLSVELDNVPERVFGFAFDEITTLNNDTDKCYAHMSQHSKSKIVIKIFDADVMPQWSADMYSVSMKLPWKEVDWTLQNQTSKILNIEDVQTSYSYRQSMVLFFISTKKY